MNADAVLPFLDASLLLVPYASVTLFDVFDSPHGLARCVLLTGLRLRHRLNAFFFVAGSSFYVQYSSASLSPRSFFLSLMRHRLRGVGCRRIRESLYLSSAYSTSLPLSVGQRQVSRQRLAIAPPL